MLWMKCAAAAAASEDFVLMTSSLGKTFYDPGDKNAHLDRGDFEDILLHCLLTSKQQKQQTCRGILAKKKAMESILMTNELETAFESLHIFIEGLSFVLTIISQTTPEIFLHSRPQNASVPGPGRLEGEAAPQWGFPVDNHSHSSTHAAWHGTKIQ
eukprot:Trichotokara_eunicae@DN4800_c0_g1_i1.p1